MDWNVILRWSALKYSGIRDRQPADKLEAGADGLKNLYTVCRHILEACSTQRIFEVTTDNANAECVHKVSACSTQSNSRMRAVVPCLDLQACVVDQLQSTCAGTREHMQIVEPPIWSLLRPAYYTQPDICFTQSCRGKQYHLIFYYLYVDNRLITWVLHPLVKALNLKQCSEILLKKCGDSPYEGRGAVRKM